MCDYTTEKDLSKHISEFALIKKEIPIEENQNSIDVAKQTFCEDDVEPLKCNHCCKVFKKLQFLNRHQVLVHDKEGTFTCEKCGKNFFSIIRWKRHLVKHSGEKNFFQCDQCDKFFKTKWGLSQHKEAAHATERPIQCEVCSKGFTYASSLKRHYKQEHDEKKPNVSARRNTGKCSCDFCGKTFFRSADLKRHLVSHSDKREFKCVDCDKEYKSKIYLARHIKLIHNTRRPFKCKGCPKSFAYATSLQKHVVSHNENRPFQCDECSKTFKLQSTLSTHKVLMHGIGGRWRCKVCGKKYPLLNTLKMHMHKHSNKKNVKCLLCPKKFKQKRDVFSHVRNTHKRKAHKTFEDAQEKGAETFDDVKVEPVVIYDPGVNRSVLNIKEEIKEEIDLNIKQEHLIL